MSQILYKIKNVDPSNAEAVKEYVTMFFQTLSKHSEQNKWLTALDDVLRRFPKYCIPHRGTIETVIANYLDSSKHHNVIEAAKCALSLQQVRHSQEKTSTPKSCWRNQMTLLCSVVHNLVDKLFPDSPYLYANNLEKTLQEMSKSPLSTALINITTPSGKYFDKRKVLIIRLKNTFIFIQAMLVEIYPIAKPIQPKLILDSILHIMSIAQTQDQPLKDLVEMKTAALKTLDALIACLKLHLIPYSPLVYRLVMQTLRWTSDNLTETKSIRCVAYNSLKEWLSVLHVHKLADSRVSLEDELTSHIINDITPPKKSVELTIGALPTRKLSKKARRKLVTTQLQDSAISGHIPGETKKSSKNDKENEIAMAALKCAESLFIVCGIFLKPTTHKSFQENLVRECFNMSSYSENQALLLLRTLEACRKTSPNTVPPPTQYCFNLYSTHVNSPKTEIAAFCSRAILDIRLHLHCSPPSLNFALQINEKKANRRKIISEKNRVVLESLLGKNKLPSSVTDDIIILADEPTAKKSKLIEDAEKISLSSESISSVEISVDSDSEMVQEISVELHRSEGEETQELNITQIQDSNIKDTEIRCVSNLDVITEAENIVNELDTVDVSKEKDIFDTIYNMETQVPQNESIKDHIDVPVILTDKHIHVTSPQELKMINEIETTSETSIQLALNESVDSINDKEDLCSQEIFLNYPGKITDKVSTLETTDDIDLPSSIETDDIQITCGQVLCNSQEENCEQTEKSPKVNGLNNLTNDSQDSNVEVKLSEIAEKKDELLSVEEMMADFVDEVQDDV